MWVPGEPREVGGSLQTVQSEGKNVGSMAVEWEQESRPRHYGWHELVGGTWMGQSLVD